MWDNIQSCEKNAQEQLMATGRFEKTRDTILSALPEIYYKDVERQVVIDKCRSWTFPPNIVLRKRFMGNAKVICLERPLVDIIKSFIYLAKSNGWTDSQLEEFQKRLVVPDSEPLMRSVTGLRWAKDNDDGDYLFIKYDNLINDTENVIKRIYTFCNLKPFKHDYLNIVNKFPENDAVYGMIGQHDVRQTISRRVIDVKLSQDVINACVKIC